MSDSEDIKSLTETVTTFITKFESSEQYKAQQRTEDRETAARDRRETKDSISELHRRIDEIPAQIKQEVDIGIQTKTQFLETKINSVAGDMASIKHSVLTNSLSTPPNGTPPPIHNEALERNPPQTSSIVKILNKNPHLVWAIVVAIIVLAFGYYNKYATNQIDPRDFIPGSGPSIASPPPEPVELPTPTNLVPPLPYKLKVLKDD